MHKPTTVRTPGTLRLGAGSASLSIDVARGGRIASLVVDGRELLLGPPSPDDASIRWGLFLMAPWVGRLAGGRVGRGGERPTLPRTHGRHAIHGLLWNRPWEVELADATTAVLSGGLAEADWPPGGRVRHAISLADDALVLEAALVAADDGGPSMPAALGWHPWFVRNDRVRLRVDASSVLETERMLPTGRVLPVAGRTDLRAGPALGRRRLDHAYVDARSPATIRWEDLEVDVEFSPSPATVVVHSPPGLVCVEPQTAWPDAPNADPGLPSGLRWLGPGEALHASMTLRWRRPEQRR